MSAAFETDPDYDAELIRIAKQAAERWKTRKPTRIKRAKALGQNKIFEADTPSRLALRVNRLINDVRLSSRDRMPDNPKLRELIERTTPVTAEELNADLVNEVVIGARDFLSVEFLERGLYVSRRVGRILIKSGGSLRARGTGFLIGPGLAITNEHVLRSEQQAAACSIEMDYVQNRFGPATQPQIFSLDPSRFFLNSKTFDFAVVAVAAVSERGAKLEEYGWLPLNAALGKIAITPKDYLNIVQHPLGREKEIVIRDNHLLDLAQSAADDQQLGPFLHYEGDTEKGSSGSPVFNDQWEVVGLHHSGVAEEDAEGRWLNVHGEVWKEGEQPVSDISWVGNEGVRVSSLIAEFARTSLDPAKRALLAPVLMAQAAPNDAVLRHESIDPQPVQPPETREPPLIRRRSAPAAAAAKLADTTISATLDIPLRVTFSLGNGSAAKVVGSNATRIEPKPDVLLEAMEPEEYADRDGYDRRFLGINVPLPMVKPQTRFGNLLKIPRPARPRDKFELRYHRFSVLMNEKRRLAYISACNVNFNPRASVTRDDASPSWRRDPRIDPEHQLGGPYYDNNDYDKGHLTRRDDAAWGHDFDDALAANWDTFHYSNAAPQHYLYNRSTGFTRADLDLWGDLENFISEQGDAQRTKLSIFNGPIFTSDDKPLKDAFAPRSFFKIVVWRDSGSAPGAMGFVLDQTDLIAELPEEAIEAGRFDVRQKRISYIQQKTDLDFGTIADWDATPSGHAEEAMDDAPLTSFADIVGL